MMKTLRIPLLQHLDEQDLDTALELDGAPFSVDQVNWPESYPYAPFCNGRIARTQDALVVDFRVSGLDLRAQNLSDNGSQWEDSCCEFFVEDPDGSCYYNFEVNPLGKVLAAAGPDRNNRVRRPAEEMEEILRTARFEGPQDYSGGIWQNDGFGDRGWLAIAIVIFAIWKPAVAIFGSYIFGGLYILFNYVGVSMQMQPLLQMLPYVVTVIVLITVSMRKKREYQPPASLGLSYFREER